MLDLVTARARLREARPARHADGYPADLRAEVSALARAHLDQGQSPSSVARALGLHPQTLQRWVATGPVGRGFVSLPLAAGEAEEAKEPAVSAPSQGPLTLVTASGHRLEGLDVAGALHLLQRLG